MLCHIVLAVISLSITPANAELYCVDGPTVDVTLSGQLVKVPVRYRPLIAIPGGKSFSPVNKEVAANCSGERAVRLQEPFEVNTLFIIVARGAAGSDVKTPANRITGFSLFRSSPDRSIDLREISMFRRRLEKAGRQLEDLPQFGGVYALRREEGKPIFSGPFMAIPGGIKTPAGNPVVVDCTSWSIAATTIKKAPHEGASCRVAYDVSPNIMVTYSFSGARIRIDEWEQLDTTFRKFLMQITDLPDR